jgi:hypothetical protein
VPFPFIIRHHNFGPASMFKNLSCHLFHVSAIRIVVKNFIAGFPIDIPGNTFTSAYPLKQIRDWNWAGCYNWQKFYYQSNVSWLGYFRKPLLEFSGSNAHPRCKVVQFAWSVKHNRSKRLQQKTADKSMSLLSDQNITSSTASVDSSVLRIFHRTRTWICTLWVQKRDLYTFAHNLAKYWPIWKNFQHWIKN